MSQTRVYFATLNIRIIAESDDRAKAQLDEIIQHQIDQYDNRCMAVSLVKMNENGIGYKDIQL